MKLWQKETNLNAAVEHFTVGDDKLFDSQLAPFDVLGSMAHVRMLSEVGLLEKRESVSLLEALKKIYHEASAGSLTLEDGIEDIHSQVELMLTRNLGEVGKKIHR